MKSTKAAQNREIVEKFSDHVLQAMDSKRVSRKELAEKSRVPPDTVYKLLRSSRHPNLQTIEKLATALDLTIPELLQYGEVGRSTRTA